MRFRDGSQLARALESLGEADASEMGTNQFLVQGPPPAPITFGNIPARPGSSGRNNSQQPAASVQQASPSSPNRALADAPTLSPGFPGSGTPGSASQFDRQISASQQTYTPFPPPQVPGTGLTQPFRSGTQQNTRGGRLAGVITALIILATLLLLGFSVYLA